MKKVLITGAGSYVGTTVERYLTENFPDSYQIDTVDMIDGSWREKSFAGYDCVYHVAGIAHSDNGKIPPEREALYRRVNTELAVETAKKAKQDGVKQFIFMSSASIYGSSAPIGQRKRISADTVPQPINAYGESKLLAEQGILPLADGSFRVVVLRPPMIYGKNCKGNFPVLEKMAFKLPVFPKVSNERSMLYVKNLAEFIHLMIQNEENGIFWPCNREYSDTGEIVRMIGEAVGKKIALVPGCSWMLKMMAKVTGLVNKAFGSLSYEPSLGEYKEDYRKYTLAQSIKETVAE